MNPPDGQTPLEYLNKISAPAPKRNFGLGLNLRTVLVLGGALIGLVFILIVIVNLGSSSKTDQWLRLNARLDSTSKLADSAGANIKNAQLRSINSELKLYISNTKRDLAGPLASLDAVPSKTSASILQAESPDVAMRRLEDGRLNARFDATYSREMSYALANLLSLYKQLLGSSSGQNKEFLQIAHDNLVPIHKSVEDFTTTTE